jgi:hypothetical protein
VLAGNGGQAHDAHDEKQDKEDDPDNQDWHTNTPRSVDCAPEAHRGL